MSFESFGQSALGVFHESPLGARDTFDDALRLSRHRFDTVGRPNGIYPLSLIDLSIGPIDIPLAKGGEIDGDGSVIWTRAIDGRLLQLDAATGHRLVDIPVPFPEPPPHINTLRWHIGGDSDVLYAHTRLIPPSGTTKEYLVKLRLPDFHVIVEAVIDQPPGGIDRIAGTVDALWFSVLTPGAVGELSADTLSVVRMGALPNWTTTPTTFIRPMSIGYRSSSVWVITEGVDIETDIARYWVEEIAGATITRIRRRLVETGPWLGREAFWNGIG